MHTVDNSAASAQPQRLTDQISDILQRAGHPRATEWLNGVHPDALRDDVNPDVQRFLINRYWRLQLGSLPINTLDERYCLVDTGEIARWLELFEQKVAPCIVTHNLPPSVH